MADGEPVQRCMWYKCGTDVCWCNHLVVSRFVRGCAAADHGMLVITFLWAVFSALPVFLSRVCVYCIIVYALWKDYYNIHRFNLHKLRSAHSNSLTATSSP